MVSKTASQWSKQLLTHTRRFRLIQEPSRAVCVEVGDSGYLFLKCIHDSYPSTRSITSPAQGVELWWQARCSRHGGCWTTVREVYGCRVLNGWECRDLALYTFGPRGFLLPLQATRHVLGTKTPWLWFFWEATGMPRWPSRMIRSAWEAANMRCVSALTKTISWWRSRNLFRLRWFWLASLVQRARSECSSEVAQRFNSFCTGNQPTDRAKWFPKSTTAPKRKRVKDTQMAGSFPSSHQRRAMEKTFEKEAYPSALNLPSKCMYMGFAPIFARAWWKISERRHAKCCLQLPGRPRATRMMRIRMSGELKRIWCLWALRGHLWKLPKALHHILKGEPIKPYGGFPNYRTSRSAFDFWVWVIKVDRPTVLQGPSKSSTRRSAANEYVWKWGIL